MAHGKSLTLRKIQPTIKRIWTPEKWAKRKNTVPGDKALWPKGMTPNSRQERRAGGDVWKAVAV